MRRLNMLLAVVELEGTEAAAAATSVRRPVERGAATEAVAAEAVETTQVWSRILASALWCFLGFAVCAASRCGILACVRTGKGFGLLVLCGIGFEVDLP